MNVWLWLGLAWLFAAFVAALFVWCAHRKPTPAAPRCDQGEHYGLAEYRLSEGMVTERCLDCGQTETRPLRGDRR